MDTVTLSCCQVLQNEAGDMFDDFADLGLEGEALEPPMPAFTEADKEKIAPCQGLLKAAKACMKRVTTAVKTKGKCECGETVAQLDDLGERAKGISPLVDELVVSLYPPITPSAVRQNVSIFISFRSLC
jgi:hypothetical protein